jgi:hypothetical protein
VAPEERLASRDRVTPSYRRSMVSARSINEQHTTSVLGLFADALATRVSRSAADIRERGLAAGDFRSSERVDLTLADGSRMSLRYAFAVIDLERAAVGVFSEHCGYFCFATANLELEIVRDDVVIERHRW